jgi:transcriptional regulator with XRE-family HTH domain
VTRENPEKLIANVGRRVAELRKSEGLTQAQLAERLGFSVQYLSRVELGTNLTLSTMAKLANAFQVTVTDLLQVPGPEMRAKRGRPRNSR